MVLVRVELRPVGCAVCDARIRVLNQDAVGECRAIRVTIELERGFHIVECRKVVDESLADEELVGKCERDCSVRGQHTYRKVC